MTALASLSPLLPSDWATLRLPCLSLVDIGGGSEAGVVFIRCVDTWHIYRFSSPHSRSFLRPLSWQSATLPPSPDIDINSFYESEMTPTQSCRHRDRQWPCLDPDCTRWHETGDERQTMSCRHCSTSYHTARLNELLLEFARLFISVLNVFHGSIWFIETSQCDVCM